MKILRLAEGPGAGLEPKHSSPPGFEFVWVSGAAEFEAELHRGGYDAILADFNALAAADPSPADRARLLAPDTPLVYWVDDQDEHKAIAALGDGITDYVLASHPQRLASALRRTCRESSGRRELRRCEAEAQRYRELFRQVPSPLLLVDGATDRVIDVNQAALDLYGYSAAEFRGLSTSDLEEVRENPVAHSPSARQRHRRKNGSAVEVELFTAAMVSPDHGAKIILVRDDTVRRQSEDQSQQLKAEWEQRARERTASLEMALKELEAFSYSVSHDLRAPLRGIDGFARALMEDCGADLSTEGVRLIQVIRNETKRMSQLIDDLLAFSRAGRQQIDPSGIDMTDLARSAFQNIAEALPGEAPSLDLKELPPARGDRSMLRQVFANLLENAVKFSARQSAPQIEISGWSESNQQVYRVRDNGVGFDPRYAHKLFAVFQRLHRQEEFAGTGVGLALVQRIVQRHGGRVWAESKLNEGASFYFALPLHLGRDHTPPSPLPGG